MLNSLVSIFFWVALLTVSISGAHSSDFLPPQVAADTFTELKGKSPFLRSIELSKSLILTGVARIEGDLFATLFDTENKQTHLVSETNNQKGWKLVQVKGDQSDLESMTAQIKVDGGEVVSIRYEKLSSETFRPQNQLSKSHGGHRLVKLEPKHEEEAKRSAVNYRDGFSSDGYPKKPPEEIVRKLSRISVQQREAINRHMIGLRNGGMGLEERRKIYDGLVDRAAQGRR